MFRGLTKVEDSRWVWLRWVVRTPVSIRKSNASHGSIASYLRLCMTLPGNGDPADAVRHGNGLVALMRKGADDGAIMSRNRIEARPPGLEVPAHWAKGRWGSPRGKAAGSHELVHVGQRQGTKAASEVWARPRNIGTGRWGSHTGLGKARCFYSSDEMREFVDEETGVGPPAAMVGSWRSRC